MICPNCRSEIGSQPVCPYCGGTVASGRSIDYEYAIQQKTIPIAQQPGFYGAGGWAPAPNASRSMNKQLSAISLRSKLTLVFSVGVFILQLITLIVMALK